MTHLNGGSKEQELVQPNITDANGKPINYVMLLLDYNECLKYSALPTNVKKELTQSIVIHNEHISFKCYTYIDSNRAEYISASRFLEKNIGLIFEVSANTQVFRCPLRVKLTKINYGPEVTDDGSGKPAPKHIEKILLTWKDVANQACGKA